MRKLLAAYEQGLEAGKKDAKEGKSPAIQYWDGEYRQSTENGFIKVKEELFGVGYMAGYWS
jgi:hypothetical protein